MRRFLAALAVVLCLTAVTSCGDADDVDVDDDVELDD